MLAFGSRTGGGRRRRIGLGVLALVACALAALGSASGASALGEQCSGGNIEGHGSWLQARAQAVWTGEAGFNHTGKASGCSGSQGSGGKPEPIFYPFGSGWALHAWGADDGIFHQKEVHFLGTTEPPAGPVGETGTQLQRMKNALSSDVVLVPIAQTSIAIVANPPHMEGHAACKVDQLTQADLAAVWAGTLTNWRLFSTASDSEPGGNCDMAVSRFVREEAAGTTYQLKRFLYELEPEPLECTGSPEKTWADLQSSVEPSVANRRWPDNSEGCGVPITVVGHPAPGADGPLEVVAANHGTITYADLPEAKRVTPELLVEIYNGVQFAGPAEGEKEANCGGHAYTLPSGWESGLNVDWSGVYGSDPEIGKVSKGSYPLCTLTWAVAAADSGGTFGNKAGTTVRDYLTYVNAANAGQKALVGHWYYPRPEAVVNAAEAALAQIGGEGEEEEPEEPEGPQILCKTNPETTAGEKATLVCPPGQGFAGKVNGSLVSETVATFKSTLGAPGSITCGQGLLSGDFEMDGSSAPGGGVTGLDFFGGEGCTSTISALEGMPELHVGLVSGPYDASRFSYLGLVGPQGALSVAGPLFPPPTLVVEGSGGECVYETAYLSAGVAHLFPTQLVIEGDWESAGGGEGCPGGLHGSARMTLLQGTSPEGESLFVASK